MKSAAWLTSIAAVICLLNGCTPPPPKIVKSDIGPGIGPFDSQGNYREDWADDPSKWRRPSTAFAQNDTPPPNANPLPPRTSSQPPRTSSQPPKQTSRPKPTVTRYTVKRGDTLSQIAKRNGSSVSAIRRANGISGSLIFPGQRLIIPGR